MIVFWWIMGVVIAISYAVIIPVAYQEIKDAINELQNKR